MYTQIAYKESLAPSLMGPIECLTSATVAPLAAGQEAEVLEFLSERPLHTVMMAGLVRDHGLVSTHNRGTFYGCRDSESRLIGVALIGHATLIEARVAGVVERFAKLAQECSSAHMILGEKEIVEEFWEHYAPRGQQMRRFCREVLLEQRWPVEVLEEVEGLRLATLEDLDKILPVQAQMAFDESGVNPLEVDPEGFRKRCARRIEMGRTWVVIDRDRVVFKADIISETPEVVYVEGVGVHPEERGRGLGSRCMSQLTRKMLRSADSVCLFVNAQNIEAQVFYNRLGYKQRSTYDSIFLQ